MQKLVILSAVVVLAASSANCARQGSSDTSSANILAPSALGDSASDVLSAKGGGGGKPGGGGGTTGGSGTLTLAMVNDVNGNGLPNWGDSVTFNVSTTATTQPNVSLTCSQNGVVVYGATTGYYASYPWPWTQTMVLSSNSWQSGSAACTAKLYYFSGTSTINLSSISFTAGA
jgi:hypothetical protein